jgi:hypothetical protein
MRVPVVFLLVLVLFAAPAIEAQAVRGTVVGRDSTPQRNILVGLIDSADQMVARTLSRDDGRFLLRAPTPGSYRLRVLRVGYKSQTSEPLVLLADTIIEYRLVYVAEAVSLARITVSVAGGGCKATKDLGPALDLWEEIRKALLTASVARQENRVSMVFRTYRGARMTPRDSIRIDEIQTHTEVTNRPFESKGEAYLAKLGYIETHGNVARSYAPDEDVLLSESFGATHCFGVATRPDHTDWIGLTFTPLARRDSTADIRGTLWVDQKTAALQYAVFQYTNPPRRGEWRVAGGHLDFEQLPNGIWVINHWFLQIPWVFGPVEVSGLPELRVQGGMLAEVRGTGTDSALIVWRQPPSQASGVVFDAATNAPVPFASIRTLPGSFSARADSTGYFTLPYEIPGIYMVVAHEPLFDSIGTIDPPKPATLASSTAVELEVHTRESFFLKQRCGKDSTATGGILVGVVYDDAARSALSRARVTATWKSFADSASTSKTREVRTDKAGVFVMCDLPRDTPLSIDVRAVPVGKAAFQITITRESYFFRRVTLNPRPK